VDKQFQVPRINGQLDRNIHSCQKKSSLGSLLENISLKELPYPPKNRHIPNFQASCLSILLYGCKSWVITEKLEKKYKQLCHQLLQGNAQYQMLGQGLKFRNIPED
jgi:hypothetical protein